MLLADVTPINFMHFKTPFSGFQRGPDVYLKPLSMVCTLIWVLNLAAAAALVYIRSWNEMFLCVCRST